MNDEILESVREGFAPVRMDRPLQAIEARARAYRRNRVLTGLGGVGLAVGLGVSLFLPMADRAAHREDNIAHPDDEVASTAVATPKLGQRTEHVSFTLISTADGTVKVTFKDAAADPKALEKSLAESGITAAVRVNKRCGAGPTPLPGHSEELIPHDVVDMEVDGGNNPTITIDGSKIPKDVTLNLSLFVDKTTVVKGLGTLLSVTGYPVTCRPWSR